jgi:hypothetical protein
MNYEEIEMWRTNLSFITAAAAAASTNTAAAAAAVLPLVIPCMEKNRISKLCYKTKRKVSTSMMIMIMVV